MNTYNMALKAYQKNDVHAQDPATSIALAFEDAALAMERAAEAIRDNDIQRRFNESMKASKILSALNQGVVGEKTEDLTHDLKVYYQRMILMIGDVNVYNNLDLSLDLAKGFRKMSQFWREAKAQHSES